MLQKLILFTLPIRIFNYRPNNAACFLSAPLASDNTIALKKKKNKEKPRNVFLAIFEFRNRMSKKSRAMCARASAICALVEKKKFFYSSNAQISKKKET